MKSKERIKTVLNGGTPDRVPRFEVWIDALYDDLGVSDPLFAHPELGQDVVMIPSKIPEKSNAWKDGLDEFGRVWKGGIYVDGELKTAADLDRFTPPLSYARHFFIESKAENVKSRYPNHYPFFGTHIGPFMSTYMAMGMQHMFRLLRNDLPLVKQVLETRTDWCIAVFQYAVELGAELIVLGDDSAHSGGPFISPRLWRSLVLPCHQRLVKELEVPVIWHSDGNMEKLLPFAVEAGFSGVHGLEPPAGNNLGKIKETYGDELFMIGNLDVNLLCQDDLEAVRADLQRCLEQGGIRGYMLSSSNSIFPGMNPAAVKEYMQHYN